MQFLFTFADEMLESEKSSLAGRVHDLEKKVLTQQDEIMCLRSTLADVLRRVNQLEGTSDRQQQHQQQNGSGYRNNSAPTTPARSTNSMVSTFSSSRASPVPQSSHSIGYSNGSSFNSNETVKLRKPLPRSGGGGGGFGGGSASPSSSKGSSIDAVLRRNTIGSAGLNSKSSHHSNGSLHSDTPSSSSVSPAPSPSPRPTTAMPSNSSLGKRWSSTGDFNVQSPLAAR